MDTRSASSAAVSELFNGRNYVVWSVQVKTYLNAKGLWGIVEIDVPRGKRDEAWTRKNFVVLHVIQTSCEPRICLSISRITSAKDAWDTLEAIKNLSKDFREFTDECLDREDLTYVDWNKAIQEFLEHIRLWDIVEDASAENSEDASTENSEVAGADDNEVASVENSEVAGADDIEFDGNWTKKNAKALYLIMDSCGSKRFSLISNIDSAKEAWHTLRKAHESEMFAKYFDSHYDPGKVDIEDIRRFGYGDLDKYIRQNNLPLVLMFIDFRPEAVGAKITNMGRTPLHVAIVARRVEILRELLPRATQQNLEIKDNAGLNVLDCCAVFGNKQMAEIIVQGFPDLLSIRNGPKQILPVVLAVCHNSSEKDMVSYLYENTDKNDLKSQKSVNGPTFINKCLYAKAFDLALDLLKDAPELLTSLDLDGVSPLMVFALSCAFPSGNQLVFWKRWIYNGGPNPLRRNRATCELPVNNAHQQEGRGESGK